MLKFFNQFFIYGFASILGKIIAVLLLPLYTNVLSKEEFGALALITSLKGIIDMFANLNIHSGVAREFYELHNNRKNLISTGFFAIILFSITIVILMLISTKFWINNILTIPKYETAFICMLLTIPTSSLVSYFSILTRFNKKPFAFSFGSLLQLIIQISLTIYFVIIVKTGINGVFYGIIFGEIFGVLYFYFLNKEFVKFTFNKLLLKKILEYSLPTIPAILAGWIDSSLGQIMIGKYISVNDAGVYSIALRIISVYLLIEIALRNVLGPFIFENYKTASFPNNIVRLYNFSAYLLIIMSINLCLLSDYVVVSLSTVEYIAAGEYLILLTIPMSITILHVIISFGPDITRKTKFNSLATIIGSTINIILLILTLPKYGIKAVPVSLAISKLVSYTLASYFTYKEISQKFPHQNILYLIFSILLCFYIKNLDLNLLYTLSLFVLFNVVALVYLYQSKKALITNFIRSKF